MKFFAKVLVVAIFILFTAPQPVEAWGGRGHAAICEAAVHMVQNPKLKEYLRARGHMMAHLCNMPDIYWRGLSEESRKFGDPTHFIDVEILGVKATQIPTDYKKIVESYTGAENKFQDGAKIFNVPKELGSVWWRADQLFRLAVEEGKKIKSLEAPKGKEEQNEENPFNKAFFHMIANMGLMGHFVGDASQPLHNTSDYDGYAANQGGLHSYYEEAVVAQFGSDLVGRITKRAPKLKASSYLSPTNVIEKMRAFSEIAIGDLKPMFKADPVTKPSVLRVDRGMSLRTPAERKPPAEGFKRFEKLILDELTRSSILLAHLWDEAYAQAGEPNFKEYKSYRYPLTVDFVMPDYFDPKAEPKKASKD